MALAFRRLDFDRFIEEVSVTEILEWNAYLNQEIEETTSANALAGFAMDNYRSSCQEPAPIEDPEQILSIFKSFVPPPSLPPSPPNS